MTALAGSIGTGNIVGVATAIVSGGPGALFWIWCYGFFAMAIKFAEASLGLHFRVANGESVLVRADVLPARRLEAAVAGVDLCLDRRRRVLSSRRRSRSPTRSPWCSIVSRAASR